MRRSQSANKYSQETRTGTNRSKLPERRRNFTLENSLSESSSKAAPVTVSGSNVNKGISISKQSISSNQLSEKKLKPSSVLVHSQRKINIEQNDSQNNDSNLSSNAVNMQQSNDKTLHVTVNSVLFSSSPSVKHEVSTPLIPPLDLRNAVALTKQNSECDISEKEIKLENEKMHTPHREEEEEQSKLRIQHAATQRTKRTQPTNLFSMEIETSPLSLSQMRTESRSSRTQKLASTRPKKRSASSSFSFAQVTKPKTHTTRYANKEHTSEHKPNVCNPSLISAESTPWSFSAVSLMPSSNSSSLLENANTFTRKAECARTPFQRVHTHNSYLSTAGHDQYNHTQMEIYTHRSSATRTSAPRWSPRSDLIITPRPASALYKMLFPASTSTQQNYYSSSVHSSPDAKARINVNYPPHHNNDDNEYDACSDNFTAECYSQPMIPVAHIRIRPLLPNLHERNDQRKVFLLNHQHLLICSSTPVAHASSETNNIFTNTNMNKTNNCSPVKCNKQEVSTSSSKNIKGIEKVQQEEHECRKETKSKPDVNKIRYKEINKSLYSSVKQKTLASSTPRPALTTRTNVTPQKSNNNYRSNKTSDAVTSGKKIQQQQQQQQQQRHHFTFEFIHDEDAAQQDVFEESVLPFVDEALMGHNVAICCYGPTGSGKTYSMIGESNEMPLTYRQGRHLNKEWKNYANTNRERVNNAQCKRSASASVAGLAAHRDKLRKRIASTRSRSSALQTETKQNITQRKMFNYNKDNDEIENEKKEQEYARGENVEMASSTTTTTTTTQFAENNAMSESDIGILPRLVLVLLERRNKPQYIIRESHSTVQAAPINDTITGSGTDKTEMTLKLMLTSITFYGVELYLDDLSNLLDPEKRTLSTNALSDIGGVSTLCTAIDKEWREWCEVNEFKAEHIHTQRQASLEKNNVKEHRVNVNDRKAHRASLSSSFMQNFNAFNNSSDNKKKNTKIMNENLMHTPRSVCSNDNANANVNVMHTTSPSPAWREEVEEMKNARESGNTSEESPPAKEPMLETQSHYTNDSSSAINNNCNYYTPRTRRNRKESRQGGGITINSLTDLHLACELARINRITSRHALNDTSSRSHALYVLRLDFDLSQEHHAQNEKEHEENKIQHQADNNNNTSGNSPAVQPEHFSSYVTLVDLAGSERVKETNVHGKEMKEAQYINKSLSALSNVVLALYQRSAHVPYRDSKLTRLLRPCLSEGRVLVLVHVAPCNAHNESVQTLKFADQIRHAKVQAHKSSSNISNHPVHNNKYGTTTNTRKNQDVCVGNFSRLAGTAVRSKNTKVNAKGNDKNCNEECEEESGGAALHEEDVNEKQLLETFAELTQHSHFDVEEEMIKHTWERNAICADLRIFTANQSVLSSNRDANTSSKIESVIKNNNESINNKEKEHDNNNKAANTKVCASSERNNNNNSVPHNVQVQELLNRYVEHCLLNPAQDSIEEVESQLEQANARRIAQCQEEWNNKITWAEEELEECVNVNRTLKSEAMTPLPLDPYVNQLIHETQACDNDLESITAERDQLRGLVALLRQRLSTHEDLLHELEREENEVELQKRQQIRLVCSATQTITNGSEHDKSSPNASMDEYEREASPLNISFTSSSVSSVMTEDSIHETSHLYSHMNSDTTKTGAMYLENKAHAVSVPRAKMLSASWRHVLADQLRLAKQMALLRTEMECFHHTDDIYEGLWARLMRMQMLLAVQVQNAALESILRQPNLLELVCNKNKALCAPRHKLFTLIQGNTLTERENEYNEEKVTEQKEERQEEWEHITTKTTVHKDEEVKKNNGNMKTPRLENASLDYSNDNNSKGKNEQMTNPLDVLYSINSRETNITNDNEFAEIPSSLRNAVSKTAIDYNNEETMQRLCLQQMMHEGVECEITFQLQERATKWELPCSMMEKENDRDGTVNRRVCTSTGRLKLCKRNKESSHNSHQHGYALEFWCETRNIHYTTSAKINENEKTIDEDLCVEQSSYSSSSSSSSFDVNAHKRSNNSNKIQQEQHYSRKVKEYLMQNNNTKQGNVNNKETIDKSKSAKTNNNVYTQQEQRQRQQLHKYNYTTLANVNKANKVNVNKNIDRQNVKTANLTKANVEAKCLQSKLSDKLVISQPNDKEKTNNNEYDDDDEEDVELCVFAIPLSDHRMEMQLHIIENESEYSAESTFPYLVLTINYAKCLSKWDRHQTNHFAHHIQLISGNNMILPALLAHEQSNGKDNNGESKHEHYMKVRGNVNNDELHECSNSEQVMELVIRFPLCTTNNKAKSVFAIEQIVYALTAVCLPRTDTLVTDKKNLECNKMNSTHVKLPNHIPYVLLCHDRCNFLYSNNQKPTRSTSTLYTVPAESTEHTEHSAEQKTNQPTFTIITTSSARGRRQRHCLPFMPQSHATDNDNTRTDKSPSPEIDEHVIGANINTRLWATSPPTPPLRRPIKSAQLETYLHLTQHTNQNSEVSLSNGMHQIICQLASLMFFLQNYFVTTKECEGNNSSNSSHNLEFYYKSIKCVRERMKAITKQIQRYIKQQIFDAEDIKGEEINNCTCSDEEQRKNMEHHSHIEDVIADARRGIGLIFSTSHDYNSECNDEEHVHSCESANYDCEKQHRKDRTTWIKRYLSISELRQYLSLHVHWTIWHWAYQWKYIMHACNEQDKQSQESSNAKNIQNKSADVVSVDIESNETNVEKNETHKNELDVNNTLHLTALQALFRQCWEKLLNMYITNGIGSNRTDKRYNEDRNSCTSHDSDIDDECDYLVDLGSEQFWHLLVEYIHKTDFDHKITDESMECITLPQIELAALPDYLRISESEEEEERTSQINNHQNNTTSNKETEKTIEMSEK